MSSVNEFESKLNKYCTDPALKDEAAEVESWLIYTYPRLPFPSKAVSLQEVEKKLWNNISTTLGFCSKKRTMYQKKLAVAATAALLIGGGIFYFNRPASSPPAISSVTPLKPGIHQPHSATLRLADGEVIDLSLAREGEIYNGHGIKIYKETGGGLVYSPSANNDLITSISNLFFNNKNRLEVPPGGEYNITFRDGSKAMVGPGSSLSFDPYVKDGRGSIELEGIAEFNVAKNAKQGFKVMIASQVIEVLGTEFNVRSYPGETGVTDLISGSVAVTSRTAGNGKRQVLKPGQRAISYSTGLVVEDIDSVYFSKLSKGYLAFRNTPLKEVLQQVGRWYNVNVVDDQVKDTSINATLFVNKPLTDVLDVLRRIPGIELHLKSDTLTATFE